MENKVCLRCLNRPDLHCYKSKVTVYTLTIKWSLSNISGRFGMLAHNQFKEKQQKPVSKIKISWSIYD